jgi:tetratricopeptide (TPR) repeat protein
MKLLLIFLTSLFTQANAQYAEGNYTQAVAQYQEILSTEPSAEVYYNLGNAYFKQGELAQAILAYERALRIDPSFKDAQHNLEFAQTRIVDNIADTQSFFLSNWLKGLRNALNERTWTILSISLFVLALLAFFFFAFSQTVLMRKSAFYISILALIISIVSCINAGSLHYRDSQRAEAIITQGIVNAKSSPDRSGNDLFTIHEGTKVVITDVISDWCCIHVGNNIGWIPLSYLERI